MIDNNIKLRHKQIILYVIQSLAHCIIILCGIIFNLSNTILDNLQSSSSSSDKFSSATLTASTTNAENVHSVPTIAFSTSSITSFGNLILLLVDWGTFGILNFLIMNSCATFLNRSNALLCLQETKSAVDCKQYKEESAPQNFDT